MSAEDEILLENIRNDDITSFNIFTKKYNYILYDCMDKYNLEMDELQECLYKIVLNKNLIIEDFKAYLYKCFRNLAYNKYKKEKVLYENIEDYELGYDEDFDSDVNFNNYISKFDKRTKEILILRFKNECTYKVISQRYNISEVAVYKIIKKACNILKKDIMCTDKF